eukprot:gene3240-4055_t
MDIGPPTSDQTEISDTLDGFNELDSEVGIPSNCRYQYSFQFLQKLKGLTKITIGTSKDRKTSLPIDDIDNVISHCPTIRTIKFLNHPTPYWFNEEILSSGGGGNIKNQILSLRIELENKNWTHVNYPIRSDNEQMFHDWIPLPRKKIFFKLLAENSVLRRLVIKDLLLEDIPNLFLSLFKNRNKSKLKALGFFTTIKNPKLLDQMSSDQEEESNNNKDFISVLKKHYSKPSNLTHSQKTSIYNDNSINNNKDDGGDDDYSTFDDTSINVNTHNQQPTSIVISSNKRKMMDDTSPDSSNINNNDGDSSFSFNFDDYDSNNNNDDTSMQQPPSKKINVNNNSNNIQPKPQQQQLQQKQNSNNNVVDELKYKWQWRSDDKWVDYDIELMYSIEDRYSRGSNKIPVDIDRYIEFSTMKQKRFDSETKQRDVRRIPIQSNNNTTTSTNYNSNNSSSSSSSTNSKISSFFSTTNNKNNNSSSSSSSNTTTSLKLNSPSTSSSLTTTGNKSPPQNKNNTSDNEKSVQWYWKDDDGKWVPFQKEKSEITEANYQAKKLKRFDIDEERFIDFEQMLQRRIDNPSRVRQIKREVGGGMISPTLTSSNSKNTGNNSFTGFGPNKSTSSHTSSSSSSGGFSKGQWKWSNDRGGWEDYPPDINELIEDGFHNKMDSIVIKINNEDKIIDYNSGVQRRSDDPSKRRNIKRFVDNVVFNTNYSTSKSTTTTTNNSTGDNKKPINNNNSSSNNSKYNQIKNEEKKEKASKPEFFDIDELEFVAPQHDADPEFDQLDPNDPDYLDQKRQLYKCGDDYLTIEHIDSWYELLEKKRDKVKPKDKSLGTPDANLNKKISIFGGDITRLEIDAIVNAAKSSLMGGGGIDGCIHRAAGPGLLRECKTIKGGCPFGSSRITQGYRLPSTFVIHTVGPTNQDPKVLTSCYESCLKLVLENNLKTVAFCCIATGIYGFPALDAAHIAIGTVRKWLEKYSSRVDRIIFCMFTQEDYKTYGKLLLTYFPIHSKS